MLATVIPIWMLTYATQFWQFIALGLLVGLAGASFSVGTPYVARWFPKDRQGLAMGIFGAGNSGAALTKFVAPVLIVTAGTWMIVPKVYAIAMLVTAILFWMTSATNPAHRIANPPSFASQLRVMKDRRAWRYSQYYSVVFGGMSGWRCGCRITTSITTDSILNKPRCWLRASRCRAAYCVRSADGCPIVTARRKQPGS